MLCYNILNSKIYFIKQQKLLFYQEDYIMFCTKCGKEYPDGTVCPCSQEQQAPPQQQQFQQPPPQQQQQYQQQPPPVSATDNKQLFCILSYIGILWIIGLIVEPDKNDPRVKFHVGQGMLLFIIAAALSIVLSIVTVMFSIIA